MLFSSQESGADRNFSDTMYIGRGFHLVQACSSRLQHRPIGYIADGKYYSQQPMNVIACLVRESASVILRGHKAAGDIESPRV